MGRRKKKSGDNANIIRILSEDPVIIQPSGDPSEETLLPSQSNPWPSWLFFAGLIVTGWLLWRFTPAWFKQWVAVPPPGF
jgi:hypothetical protein